MDVYLLQRSHTLMGFLLLAPFFLNDFLFILFDGSFYPILSVDYATRILVLGVAIWGVRAGKLGRQGLGLHKIGISEFVKGTIILSVLGVLIDRKIGSALYPFFAEWALFHYPPAPSLFIAVFDLTIGVALVALSEEVVFRGFLMNWFREKGLHPAAIVIVSSVLFGLMHWAGGPHAVINSTLWAVAPAVFVLRYKSIYPAVVAHYVTDLVAFGLHYL